MTILWYFREIPTTNLCFPMFPCCNYYCRDCCCGTLCGLAICFVCRTVCRCCIPSDEKAQLSFDSATFSSNGNVHWSRQEFSQDSVVSIDESSWTYPEVEPYQTLANYNNINNNIYNNNNNNYNYNNYTNSSSKDGTGGAAIADMAGIAGIITTTTNMGDTPTDTATTIPTITAPTQNTLQNTLLDKYNNIPSHVYYINQDNKSNSNLQSMIQDSSESGTIRTHTKTRTVTTGTRSKYKARSSKINSKTTPQSATKTKSRASRVSPQQQTEEEKQQQNEFDNVSRSHSINSAIYKENETTAQFDCTITTTNHPNQQQGASDTTNENDDNDDASRDASGKLTQFSGNEYFHRFYRNKRKKTSESSRMSEKFDYEIESQRIESSQMTSI